MKYFKKVIAGVLLVAVMITGLFLLACDGCKDEDKSKTAPTNETEIDLSGMWDDIDIEIGSGENANDSDYTDWVR